VGELEEAPEADGPRRLAVADDLEGRPEPEAGVRGARQVGEVRLAAERARGRNDLLRHLEVDPPLRPGKDQGEAGGEARGRSAGGRHPVLPRVEGPRLDVAVEPREIGEEDIDLRGEPGPVAARVDPAGPVEEGPGCLRGPEGRARPEEVLAAPGGKSPMTRPPWGSTRTADPSSPPIVTTSFPALRMLSASPSIMAASFRPSCCTLRAARRPGKIDVLSEKKQEPSATGSARGRGEAAEEIARQSRLVSDIPQLRDLLEAVPDPCAVLNRRKEIVFANRAFEAISWINLGRLPGEHARDGPRVHPRGPAGMRGSSPSCQTCGALHAINEAQDDGAPAAAEWRLTRRDSEGNEQAIDLLAWTTPLRIGGEDFLVLALKDVSGEKRRQVLERIFFHDLLNTAGSLKSLCDLLGGGRLTGEDREVFELIRTSAGILVEEIEAQRTLLAAEAGGLTVRWEPVRSREVLFQVEAQYRHHALARGRACGSIPPRRTSSSRATPPSSPG